MVPIDDGICARRRKALSHRCHDVVANCDCKNQRVVQSLRNEPYQRQSRVPAQVRISDGDLVSIRDR